MKFESLAARSFPAVNGELLSELQHETLIAPREPSKLISDPKDAPILNAAILEDVDIVISGDRHFLSLGLERPEVLTAAQYLERMGANGW